MKKTKQRIAFRQGHLLFMLIDRFLIKPSSKNYQNEKGEYSLEC